MSRTIAIEPHWEAFRSAARVLLRDAVAPESLTWTDSGAAQRDLELPESASHPQPVVRAQRPPETIAEELVHPDRDPDRLATVPRRFIELGESVACFRHPAPWDVLYRTLWRLTQGERLLLDDHADPLIVRLNAMERAVRRDAHKMKAYVRFRAIDDLEGERFVAWFEPRHRIVRYTAPFFERRFPSMRWSILTPDECVHWDGEDLSFTPGVTADVAPRDDQLEAMWLTYYEHTFNPARVRVRAMLAEMPRYYWRNLPEAGRIHGLLQEAPARVREMIALARTAADPQSIDAEITPEAGGAAETKTFGERLEAEPNSSSASARPAGHVSVAGTDSTREALSSGSTLCTRQADDRPGMRLLPKVPATAEPAPLSAAQQIEGIRIGVAGWDYPDWAGRVYPATRYGVDRLRWVGASFDLLEVNSTFYRPASPRVARSWLERTADFPHLRFAAKLLRAFTHEGGPWRKADVAAVRAGMLPLLEGGKLVSLLIQFPWSFRNEPDQKRRLIRILDEFAEFPIHVEVRHASWDAPRFRDWLGTRGVGLVCVDQPMFRGSLPPATVATNKVAYLRLHGRNAATWFRTEATRDERYDYRYSEAELSPWVARARELVERDDVDEVQVVLNNHYRGQAVDNAREFRQMLLRAEAVA